MWEVADSIRRHGAALRAALGTRLLPSQARALRDLVACRTAACGGQRTQCTACGGEVYRYHSCRNRHCPKCGGDQTARWLERHRERLLPCPHFLITVTLPSTLRALAFSHQALVYGALMRSAAAALQVLAADPRYVGAQVGCIAVLHTWTRALLFLTAYGTLYRALHRLERAKLIKAFWEDPHEAAAERRPRRRLYRLTALSEVVLRRARAQHGAGGKLRSLKEGLGTP